MRGDDKTRRRQSRREPTLKVTRPTYRRKHIDWITSPQGLDLRLDVVDIRGLSLDIRGGSLVIRGLSLFRLGTLGAFARELSGKKDDTEGGHEDQSPNVD